MNKEDYEMSVWREDEEIRNLSRQVFLYGLLAGVPVGIVIAVCTMMITAVYLGF